MRLSSRRVRTPYGFSNPVHLCESAGFRFLFLSRHGEKGYEKTAPYVNYRANIYAAKSLGVTRIVAWTGPGAISRKVRPGDLVLPDDLLDFTRNRPSTFYEGKGIGFLRQFPVFCETAARSPPQLRSEAPRRRGEAFTSAAPTPAPRGRASRPPPRSGFSRAPGRISSG